MKNFISPLIVALVLLTSCKEETACDTAGYTLPEITLVSPESADFEAQADTLFYFEFFFTAQAGLNTFSMNGEPIHAFVNGETESQFVFSRYFWESGTLEFILHDLCNQSTSITLNIKVIHPSY